MRHAPPVSVRCQGRGWRQVQSAVYGLAAATSAVWAAQHLGEATWPAAAVVGVALAAFVVACTAASRLLRAPPVALRWDGRQWLADDEPQRVSLMLHAGSFVLLRLNAASGTRWLAIGRGETGAAWHGLLVALHATRAAPGPWPQGEGG